MPNLNKILKGIMDVAETTAPLLGGQGAAAVAAAAALARLIEDAKDIAGPQDAAKLDELQAQVNAHADATIDRLRGTGGTGGGG